jgi:hypothetical protein
MREKTRALIKAVGLPFVQFSMLVAVKSSENTFKYPLNIL